MNDDDIRDMFAAGPAYDDAPVFAERVVRSLRMRLWFRQGLVVLAGFIGGIYALAQFVRMPDFNVSGTAFYGQTLQKAAADSDQALRASAQFLDVSQWHITDVMGSSAHYLNLMQTPVFFWVSFMLCAVFLGLYYAYSREETI